MLQTKIKTQVVDDGNKAARSQPGTDEKPPGLAPQVQKSEAVGLEPPRASSALQPPSISLPPSGGAIRSLGEKFSVNQINGTANFSIPIATTPGRSGFGPSLTLTYDSSSGNGIFGLGWQAQVPSITRALDKQLPQYIENGEFADVFVLAGAEDLVPQKILQGNAWVNDVTLREVGGAKYSVQRYRPRTEGAYLRIERWTAAGFGGSTYWRTITKDNITTIFGQDSNSRVADPNDPATVFSWLICAMYDSRGNATVYHYKAEDSTGVSAGLFASEMNRTTMSRTANRYLKSIKYGNSVSRLVNPDLAAPTTAWYFELIFDYGEHNLQAPTTAEDALWLLRPDPFSTYRPGFEVRTYRLCRRILMFHHFPNEPNVGQDCLVSSTNFNYANAAPDSHSFLVSVSSSGYRRSGSGYTSKSIPPIEFTYTMPVISSEIEDIITDNDPVGLSNNYQFVDLDGEGVSGILTSSQNTWYYKPNLGGGQFADVYALPNPSSDKQTFMDLNHDSRLELVDFESPFSSYVPRIYAVDADGDVEDGWGPVTPFKYIPNISWNDPNMTFVDLNGDGLADVLITEEDVITYYPSLGLLGFGGPQQIHVPLDENIGPRVVLSDPLKTIHVADMSGDGLLDIVRVRNGAVSYWPNLGYGHFGRRVVMDGLTDFDSEDMFRTERVVLGDIDGSGTTDIVYVGLDGIVKIFFNLSGNGFSAPQKLNIFPQVNNSTSIKVVDLLGKGTSCLVWSSSLPADALRPLKYVELMKEKPNLLISVINNRGNEAKMHYVPSTKFYLQDKAAGKTWITRLPFPIYVVEHVEHYDYIAQTRSANRYAYHDGYYDGFEKEFRGFAMVERWDTEEFSSLGGVWPKAANDSVISNTPPVLTKTWYHNGAYIGQTTLETLFRRDYFQEPGLTAAEQASLTALPGNTILDEVLVNGTSVARRLTTFELREAYRALKGSELRTEVYALDGSTVQSYPYTTSEQIFRVRLLQPRGDGIYQYSVFQTFMQESLSFHYDRQVYTDSNHQVYMDPRVMHVLNLNTDQYGNTLQNASIAYGRRRTEPDTRLSAADRAKQAQMYATYTNVSMTNAILDQDDEYVLPVAYETMGYELLKLQANSTDLVQIDHLRATVEKLNGQADLPLEDWSGAQATGQGPYRRMLSNSVNLFRSNDLSGPLALGTIESLMLPYETYALSLTDDLIRQTLVDSEKLSSSAIETTLSKEGYYVHGYDGNDQNWWTRSGTTFFAADTSATAKQELTEATANFFMTRRFRSPFHSTQTPDETFVDFDPYLLMVQEVRDELGNRRTIGSRNVDPTQPLLDKGFSYVMMKPVLVMDPNRNRSAAVFDEIGNVIATALMGKPEEALGDSVNGFVPISDAAMLAFMQNPQTQSRPQILQNATTVNLIDAWAYYRTKASANPQPIVQCHLFRETHVSDSPATRIQCKFAYADGSDHTIQQKAESEPDATAPRWNCTGWVVFNNKGDAVQTYEPFYTTTPAFQYDYRAGVASTKFYDPIGRTVGVLNPDHTWTKVRFDSWKIQAWDENRTVLMNPKTDPDIGAFFSRLPDTYYLPTWYQQRVDGGFGPLSQTAAQQSAVFSNLDSITFSDSLGRNFLTLAENIWQRTGEAQPTTETTMERRDIDIQGRAHDLTDTLGRVVMRFDYTIGGEAIHMSNMDEGEIWTLSDIKGAQLYSWNSRGYRFHQLYDAQRRPVSSMLMLNSSPEIQIGKTIYGESVPNAESLNMREKTYDSYDQAGRKLYLEYDFKGNLLESQRQIPSKYDDVLDISSLAYEPDTYMEETTYDALNRPNSMTFYQNSTTPSKSTSIPGYDSAGLLRTLTANLPLDTSTQVVRDIQYTAMGQRSGINYGNGSTTTYTYDRLTQRLSTLVTVRPNGSKAQNLSYVYDAAGNITNITDAAQQTVYFDNTVVDPSSSYIYDALNRLIQATGREHLGQIGSTAPGPWDNDAGSNGQDSRDGKAMARYTESYYYDHVDNIQSVKHAGSSASTPGWTRTYTYTEPSLLEAGVTNNRLSSTSVGSTTSNYSYNGPAGVSGCMTSMPHLSVLNWGFNDMIQAAATQKVNSGTPETTYFQYDGSNARSRKVTNRQAAEGAVAARKSERIYIGPFEVYREYAANGRDISLERQSFSLTDGSHRVLLAETRTIGDTSSDPAPRQLLRYQYKNHIDSSCLELDATSAIITYEEYTPLGSSSYRATEGSTETPKRYRYASKERDDETGFYDYGARCYAPWLGRWISADPAGVNDGFNVYAFVRNNPIMKGDSTGMQAEGEEQNMSWYERARASASGWVQGNPYARGVLNGAGNAVKSLATPTGAAMLVGGIAFAAAFPVAGAVLGAAALGYAAGKLARAAYDAHENPTDANKEHLGEVIGEEGMNLLIAHGANKIGGAGGNVLKEDILPALGKLGEGAAEAFGPKLAPAGAGGGRAGGMIEGPRAPAEESPLALQSSAKGGGKSGGGGAKPAAQEPAGGGAKPAAKREVQYSQPKRMSKPDRATLEKVVDFAKSAVEKGERAVEAKDVKYLKAFGSKDSELKGLGNLRLRDMNYGRILERMLAHLIRASGDLRIKVEYIANVRNQSEMFPKVGSRRFDFTFESATGTRRFSIEFTTGKAFEAHFAREGFSGPNVIYIIHPPPPKLGP